MQVSPGTRLGPYEILAHLGGGGMGEVWRARDTRLGRNVAIKLLSPELAKNSYSKLRLQREARSIAQLSHPHICTLLGTTLRERGVSRRVVGVPGHYPDEAAPAPRPRH